MKLPAMDWRRLKPGLPKRDATPGDRRGKTEAPAPLLGADALARPTLVLAVLAFMVVGSALAVIYGAYQYRVLFNQHQNLVANWDELQVEWGQLVLEESAWAANSRIEQVASKRLDMLVPEPGMIEIVRHER